MKNIFKRALALTLIAVFFAVSASAASLTFSDVAYDNTTGKLNLKVNGYESGKDATILVLKSGVTPAAATNNDIIFIDQVTIGAGETIADYAAPIKVRAAAVGADNVNVWVGGDDIATAIPYTKAGDAEGTASIISLGETTTDSYTIEIPAGTYKTIAEAEEAAIVKKNGAVITTGYTLENVAVTGTNNYTVNVKVDGKVVATTTVTITPDTPGGKTGIKGTVQRRGRGKKYEIAPAAFVMITNGTTIVATAVTDADGKFEVEVPAGTYGSIIRFGLLDEDGFTSFANTILTGITVTEGAITTINSAEKDFVAIEKRLTGDANDDGVVNTADLDDVKSGLAS